MLHTQNVKAKFFLFCRINFLTSWFLPRMTSYFVIQWFRTNNIVYISKWASLQFPDKKSSSNFKPRGSVVGKRFLAQGFTFVKSLFSQGYALVLAVWTRMEYSYWIDISIPRCLDWVTWASTARKKGFLWSDPNFGEYSHYIYIKKYITCHY